MAQMKEQVELIRGRAAHRRTEGDYMGVMLEAVTLDDWKAVVNNAKALAQAGDAQARAWLAHYLMGKPEGKASTPLTVVVAQLNGADPLVDELAHKVIMAAQFPETDGDWKDEIRSLVAAEMVERIKPAKAIEDQEAARPSGDSGD
jgi:hypothetical protein